LIAVPKSNPIVLAFMKTPFLIVLLASLSLLVGAEPETAQPDKPAPATDRVKFPDGYAEKFKILRSVDRVEKGHVVTIFGNDKAASVTRTNDLPYPNGSIIVMETSEAMKNPDGKPLLDDRGRLKKGAAIGLHVMRREKNFGEAYSPNRSGEWEFVEYRPDRSYITPPAKSASCAECHVKAGTQRDFVYQARLGAQFETR
jgi:hypothetical protein